MNEDRIDYLRVLFYRPPDPGDLIILSSHKHSFISRPETLFFIFQQPEGLEEPLFYPTDENEDKTNKQTNKPTSWKVQTSDRPERSVAFTS